MAISPVKMFFYSHKSKFSNKQEQEICEAIKLADNKVEFLLRFNRQSLTAQMFETAFLSSVDERENILLMIPKSCIKNLRNLDLLSEILKNEPLDYMYLDFSYFMKEENEDMYFQLLSVLGGAVDKKLNEGNLSDCLSELDSAKIEEYRGLKIIYEETWKYTEQQLRSKRLAK